MKRLLLTLALIAFLLSGCGLFGDNENSSSDGDGGGGDGGETTMAMPERESYLA